MNLAVPVPTRAAGLARLAEFTPFMGEAYAAKRNYDAGPKLHEAVSRLSPWLTHRLISEAEVIEAAMAAHGAQRADKFIQEVLWRTYWKGWLQQRPGVWRDYREAVAAALPGHSEAAMAMAGQTGIACMDEWARELVQTGYLHNHARMWFASIWCFTLMLPWQRGADFFLRHLLDADAASNTLSWRWVAGLQTRGKHYVARAENIARYTNGRFNPAGQLNESPSPLPAGPVEPRVAIAAPAALPTGRVALLLHEHDLLPETLDLGQAELVAIGGMAAPEARSPGGCAALAQTWAQSALKDGLERAALHFGVAATGLSDVAGWAEAAGCENIVTPFAPVGWVADRLAAIADELRPTGIRLHFVGREWDNRRWPHATAGFFGFFAGVRTLP
jgi:deoxyribodipyrimidine photo-lyase